MSHIRRIAHQNKTMLLKTASYYVIHICVAAMVAYAVTGFLFSRRNRPAVRWREVWRV